MPSLTEVHRWREKLDIESPVLTRECVQGIIIKILHKERKAIILFGKCHEKTIKIADIFPIEYLDTVSDWTTRKKDRGPDLPLHPIDKAAKKKCKKKRKSR